MSIDQSVIISPGAAGGTTIAQHRDFPEIRADGSTVREAGEQLINHLTRALDSALLDWRRERLEHAIQDVQKFLAIQGG